MNWILCGFKGSGKSYWGKKTSLHFDLPFLDTDKLIEEKIGITVREYVQKEGEAPFRLMEKQIVHSLRVENTLIAIGGGTILDPDNVRQLKSLGTFIYLKRSEEWLKPFSPPPPFPSFETLYCQRRELYETIADYTLILDEKEEDTVLKELWEVINLAPSSAL